MGPPSRRWGRQEALDDVDDELSEPEPVVEAELDDESLDELALDESEVELEVDDELVIDDFEEPPRESFL
jgi:hypothetical protein